MKKFLGILGGIAIFIVLLGVWLFGFGGYMPWTYHVAHGDPQVVGTRLDAKGAVVQKIYRQMDNSSVGVLMTPEGPRNSMKSKTGYFLQQGNSPMVPLAFLSDVDFRYFERKPNDVHSDLQFCDKFLPVTNSSFWIAAGTDPLDNFTGGNDFHVLVFDEKHLVSHHTFSMKADYEHPEAQFQFSDGNRTIKIKTPLGYVVSYDVLADRETDLR
jgi:hypothetical protein